MLKCSKNCVSLFFVIGWYKNKYFFLYYYINKTKLFCLFLLISVVVFFLFVLIFLLQNIGEGREEHTHTLYICKVYTHKIV